MYFRELFFSAIRQILKIFLSENVQFDSKRQKKNRSWIFKIEKIFLVLKNSLKSSKYKKSKKIFFGQIGLQFFALHRSAFFFYDLQISTSSYKNAQRPFKLFYLDPTFYYKFPSFVTSARVKADFLSLSE